jgi:hypothetical protein
MRCEHDLAKNWCELCARSDEIDRLRAEVEALRANDRRYRHLREHGDAGCTEKDGYGGQQLRVGADLDAHVDAAITKVEAGNG